MARRTKSLTLPKAPSTYRGKLALLKDGAFHINRSQKERASAFVRALKKYPKEIQVADGHAFEFGSTHLAFSPPCPTDSTTNSGTS